MKRLGMRLRERLALITLQLEVRDRFYDEIAELVSKAFELSQARNTSGVGQIMLPSGAINCYQHCGYTLRER